jgi:hypothetical protein
MRLERASRLEDSLAHVSVVDVLGSVWKSCIMRKGKLLPSPSNEDHASTPLAVVHIDTWGPARIASKSGCRYFLAMRTDSTRKIHLTFTKQKSEAYLAMMVFINKVEQMAIEYNSEDHEVQQ